MWWCNKLFQLLWSVWPDHKVLPTEHKQWSQHHCVCPPTESVTKAEVGTGKDRAEDCHDALFNTLGQHACSFPNRNPGVKCDHIRTDHHVCTSPYSATSVLVADPQADIWSSVRITSISMVDLQEEDQITQVTDPSAGCAPWTRSSWSGRNDTRRWNSCTT
jgi:hypothetical protein